MKNFKKLYYFFVLLTAFCLIAIHPQYSFAQNTEEFKCDLMLKGYEFTNEGLSEAIIKNDLQAVELFVKADININLPDKEGYNALDRAIKVKDKDAVIFLCKAGGESLLSDIPEEFAAIISLEQNSKDNNVVNTNTYTNIKKETIDNKLPEQKKEELTEKTVEPSKTNLYNLVNDNLLEETAKTAKTSPDLNKLTDEGLAPIHYAVFNDNPAMVHILLSAGAFVNQKTSDGLTPLDIAVLNDQKTVARVIMEYGGSLGEQVAKELIKFGCPVEFDAKTNLYDASFENIFSTMIKIQQKLNSQDE